ncbi:hypothetical protein COCON_G00000490 [Conger conger]|uniref:Uncharacterized protein n=1 Tax=Conger conger TaxID=82655 RepID=A0A9Q1E0I6_CONCO|nr:hypothetical protein COCON_G00000490 [Conger conger]
MVFITTTLKSVMKYLKKKRAVSSLDEESRWTVHYAAPWREQEDLLLPGTRPTCVEELHRQAKLNLKPNISECDKLSRDWWRSSWYCPQHSTLSTYSLQSHGASQQDYEEVKKPTGSSAEEHLEFLPRPQTPPGEESDDPAHTAWSHALPLPTPEERMRQQALAITAHIVPIDITGETFDRQASVRRSMVSMVTSDTTDRWRQTTPGVPRDIQQEAGQAQLPGHSSYACSVTSSPGPPPTCNSSCQTEDEEEEEEEEGRRDEAEERTLPPSARRIRAQRGQGRARPAEPLYHSLPRLHASARTEPRHNSAPCCPEDQHAGTLQTGHQSQQASAPPTPNPPPPESRPPPGNPACRAAVPRSESSQSDASSAVTADQWEYEYEALPSSPLSSRCSSPAGCRSLGSAGGARSQSHGSIGPKRAVYRCWQHHSERSGLAAGRPMCRSISLRKAKRPPAPPARSDSLPSAATPTATPFTSAPHGHASCKDLWVLRKCSSPSNSGWQNAPSTPEKSLPNSVSLLPLTSTPRSVPAPPSPVPLKGLREFGDADKGMCSLGPSPPRFTTPILQVLQPRSPASHPHREAQRMGPTEACDRGRGPHPGRKHCAVGRYGATGPRGNSRDWGSMEQQAPGENSRDWGSMEQQAPGENSRDWGSMEQQAPGENSREWGSVEVDSESGGSTPLNCSRESLVSEISTRSLEELQFPALSIQERELPPYPCGSGAAGDTDSDSSATGSVSSMDERNADVFEEMLEELLTPMPPHH